MKSENSFGIIPLRLHHQNWQVLLVQHYSGYWAFPKGHADNDETPTQAAERELFEETGLSVHKYLSPDPLKENYIFTFQDDKISKTVHYFIALVKGKIIVQESEIKDGRWFDLPIALDTITFKESKRLCLQVSEFLKAFDNQGNPLLADKENKEFKRRGSSQSDVEE